MAPKAQAGKRLDVPVPPPETDPFENLPEDVRALEECPFPVEWQPVVSMLQFQTPEIDGLALRDTLLGKEKIRVVQVFDLVLRLDPASQLSQNVRSEMEAHLSTGAPLETFVPSAANTAAVLDQRFQRDKCMDWKNELVRRREALKVFEDEDASCQKSLSAAQAALQTAKEQLLAWEAAQEAARAAAEEEGVPPDEDDADSQAEAPREQEQHEEALATVASWEGLAQAAAERLAKAAETMHYKYVEYRPYWVEGLPEGVEELLAAADAGLQLRGVIWAHVAPPPEPVEPQEGSEMWAADGAEGKVPAEASTATVATDAGGTPADGSRPKSPGKSGTSPKKPGKKAEKAEAVEEPPAPSGPPLPSLLWLSLKEASEAAAWEEAAGRLVALEVVLPPAPKPEAPPPDDSSKGKKPASGRGKKPAQDKKGKAEEEGAPPPTPPSDAAGWDLLLEVVQGLCARARVYDEWRARAKVYNASTPEPQLSTAYYDALLDSVPPERVSVAVVMHALLEQVSRNAQGEEAISEGEQALAEASARAAIASALFGLCPDDEGGSTNNRTCADTANGDLVEGTGDTKRLHSLEDGRRLGTPPPAALVFKPKPDPPTSYTMVVEGDDLAAAAAGMHTGYVRPVAGAQKGSVWGLRGSGIGADDIEEEEGMLEGATLGNENHAHAHANENGGQPHQTSTLVANGGVPEPGVDKGNKGMSNMAGKDGTQVDTLSSQTPTTNPTNAKDTGLSNHANSSPNPSPDPTAPAVAAALPAGSKPGDPIQTSRAAAQTGVLPHGLHTEGLPASKADLGTQSPSGPGLPLFVPGRGELDVDAVEKHMVELLRVPGAGREGMADTPVMDDMARSLKNTALKAHAGNIPLGTVQRCQLLDVFASMLPESTRLAHEQPLLQRRHTRHMPPHILKQVLSHALMEYPHRAVSYYPLEDAALVAAFAGGFERHTGPCLPVALTFSKYYTRSVEVARSAAAPPEEGPKDPAAVRHAEQTAAAAEAAAAYQAYYAKLEGKNKRPADAHVLFSEPGAASKGSGAEARAGGGEAMGEGGDGGSDAEEGEGAAAAGGATAGQATGTGVQGTAATGGEVHAELLMPEMVYRVEPGLIGKAEEGPEVRLQYLPTGHVLSTGPTLAPLTISKGPDTLVFMTSDHKGVARQPEQLARARAAEVASGDPTANREVRWSKDASEEAYDGPILVATHRDGSGPIVSVTHKNRAPPPPPVFGPTPEELEALRQQEEAAAAEKAAAEAATKPKKGAKPGSGRGSKDKEAADKKKKEGPIQTPPETPAAQPAEPPPPPPPAEDPILAVTAEAVSGASLELTTEGVVLVKPPPGARTLGSHPSTHRGVDVHGAPVAGGDLAQFTPQKPSLQAVTVQGALVSSFANGGLRVLHADGTVSERLHEVEGWVEANEPSGEAAEEPAPAKGWLRVLPDGTRFQEVDDDAVPFIPLPAAPSSPDLETTTTNKGTKKSGKGKEDEEEAPVASPPPPPPPRQIPLPPLRSASVVDPDGGARVLMLEDLVLHVVYPDGSTLLQDVDGTRISRAPDGAWSLELEGVPAIQGSPAGIAYSAGPGLHMQFLAESGAITLSLPDSSRLLLAQSMAVHVPGCDGGAPHPLTAKTLISTMQGFAAEELEAAAPLAACPPVQGAAVFNLVSGAAAMRAKSENLLSRQAEEAGAANEQTEGNASASKENSEAVHGNGAAAQEMSNPSVFGKESSKHSNISVQPNAEHSRARASPEQAPDDGPEKDQEQAPPGIAELCDGCDVWFTIPPSAHGIGPCGVPVSWPKPPKLVTVMYPEAPPQPPPPPPPPKDEDEEEMLDEDGEPISPPPPPPPLPPPPPVVTVHPIAQGCPPRLFVVYPTGDGYEILDPDMVSRIAAQALAQPHTVVEVQPLTSAPEPGTVLHSYLSQVPRKLPHVPPLPLGATALAQQFDPTATELIPSLPRTSTVLTPAKQQARQQQQQQQQQRQQQQQQQQGAEQATAQEPQEGLVPTTPVSSRLYMPRVVAYEPPAPQQPPPLPVLVYQEIHELPFIDSKQAEAIHAAIAEAEHDAALTAEGHTRVVPHKDIRPDVAQAADEELVQQVLALRQEAAARVQRAQSSIAQRDGEVTAACAAAARHAAEQAAAAEAAARKERRPWPPKVGPFDATPKRPDPAAPILPYWAAEEGLVASAADTSLRPGAAPLPLPAARPPSQTRAGSHLFNTASSTQQLVGYATPGVPSQTTPGVYFSPERAATLQQQQQQQQQQQRQQEESSSVPGQAEQQQQCEQDHQTHLHMAEGLALDHPPHLQENQELAQGAPMAGMPAPRGVPSLDIPPGVPGSGGSSLRRPTLPPVPDYSYPAMGHTEILARAGLGSTAAHQLPPGPRSHLYDVYGQPRTTPPPLPRTYKEEQADLALNTRHIAVEGDVLRAPGSHTSSGSLLRASGKAGRQFALSPAHIHFGSVALGSVAHAHARLRNISTGPARFTVDRPSLPLRVIHKPGALAAGMETLLTVELVAETPGNFVGEIVVRSELNVLVLSVSAKIAEVPPQAAGTAKGGGANAASSLEKPDRASSAGSMKGVQQQPQAQHQHQQQKEGEGVPLLDEQRGLDAMQAQPA